MRNEGEHIKVFVVDSEPGTIPDLTIDQAKDIFGKPLTVTSTTLLQVDFL